VKIIILKLNNKQQQNSNNNIGKKKIIVMCHVLWIGNFKEHGLISLLVRTQDLKATG
jgi:hypothetical protein